MSSDTTQNRDAKVLEDLQTVEERITLCQEMTAAVSETDEALLAVVGFLEACAPRIVDLIEAGASGVLTEATLMKCLEVNDKLLAALSDSDDEPKKSGGAQKQDSPPSNAKSPDYETDLARAAAAADPFAGSDDLLSMSTPGQQSEPALIPTPSPAPANLKSTGDDDHDDFLLKPAAAAPAPNSNFFLRAPSGGPGVQQQPPAVLRAPSGGVSSSAGSLDDIFATLPPPAPATATKSPAKQPEKDDPFADFADLRSGKGL